LGIDPTEKGKVIISGVAPPNPHVGKTCDKNVLTKKTSKYEPWQSSILQTHWERKKMEA